MICYPEKNDIPRIKEIWQTCFGDSKETVDYFFDTCFSSENCFVNKVEGKTVSALQMIPCEIADGENRIPSKYMYAVCTDPDYQGKGYMSDLIDEALKAEKEKGTQAVLCVPENDRLFDFYKRFGFTNGLYCSSLILNRNQIKEQSVKCRYFLGDFIGELNFVRNNLLKNHCFVSFPDEYLKLCRGFDYKFSYTEDFYCIFFETEDSVYVADCFYKDEKSRNEMFYSLIIETDMNDFVIEFPSEKKYILKGVIRFLDNISIEKPIYLGIDME